MTTSQAAELRVKWKQQTQLPKCDHVTLELEWSEGDIEPAITIALSAERASPS